MDTRLVWNIVRKIREKSPLVHNITNFVVMNNTANGLLALGAAAFTFAGWLFWRWENLATRRTLRVPRSPGGMEPTEL